MKDFPPLTSVSVATFGGGCFWCTEAMFSELKGVISAVSGYSSGSVENPSYHAVCSGSTGHAEVIQVEYNAEVISYQDLIRVHMGSHDPTTLNSQGADHGTQYRSIILPRNEDERQVAVSVIKEFEELLGIPIVTEVTGFETFYPAEDNHQCYYQDNPFAGYCNAVITPKMAKFRDTFQKFIA